METLNFEVIMLCSVQKNGQPHFAYGFNLSKIDIVPIYDILLHFRLPYN